VSNGGWYNAAMNPRIFKITLALALLLGSGAIRAQSPAPAEAVGILEDPCAALAPVPPEVAKFRADVATARAEGRPRPALTPSYLEIHTQWIQRRLTQDFFGLCAYRDENAKLGPSTSDRVVFFGDSITELWRSADPEFFTGDRVNRGISGQTTAQMLGRFRHDVVALRPRAVHIMAGTNDLAGNTGPTTLAWIQANIRGMVDIARANRIHVILAAVPPAAHFNWRPAIRPIPQIEALNAWLREYAASEKLVFVDYGGGLGDGAGGMKAGLSADGVHPNASAYALMRKLAEGAMHEALGR
jgi:lysophospholipase L1-like esterase